MPSGLQKIASCGNKRLTNAQNCMACSPWVRVVLDLGVLTDGKAKTEFNSMVASLEIVLGPVLVAKLSMLTCAFIITNHANTADLGAKL